VILYPAVDILDGQAVRLVQGDFAERTVYEDDPLDAALAWVEAGARALCVASVGEALALREALPDARLIVLGPTSPEDVAGARAARLELDDVGRLGRVGVFPDRLPLLERRRGLLRDVGHQAIV